MIERAGVTISSVLTDPIHRGVAAAIAALAVWYILCGARNLLARRVRLLSPRLGESLSALLAGTHSLTMLAVAAAVVSAFVPPPPSWHEIVRSAIVVMLFIQGGFWFSALSGIALKRVFRGDNPALQTVLLLSNYAARVVIWSLVALLILENLGVNVLSLLAGVGIGGIAIALAVKNILSDLFASFSMVLDKPFVVGDMIQVNDAMGRVEHIGIKTTRIRSVTGEQLVYANSDLLAARIRNFERMRERRMTLRIGVTYQTVPSSLAEIPRVLRSIVAEQPQVRFDRAHLIDAADSALVFEAVYFYQGGELTAALDTHQRIILETVKALAERKIEFAYPTQTVHLATRAA